jgi:hypothetical protein
VVEHCTYEDIILCHTELCKGHQFDPGIEHSIFAMPAFLLHFIVVSTDSHKTIFLR